MNKRKIKKYLILILLAVILPTGCGKSVEIQDVSGSYEDVDSKDEQKYESQQSEAATGDAISAVTEESILPQIEEEETVSTYNEDEILPNTKAEDNSGDVASIIVKSENNLSDSEKQEIIEELSKEVDNLLNEINCVE